MTSTTGATTIVATLAAIIRAAYDERGDAQS